MKHLWNVLLFLIGLCIGFVAMEYVLKDRPAPSSYTLHHHPSEIQLFDKWEVVVGDSICYAGSLSDCAAWVEMKEKGMMK
jgi:hypothetical protein